MLTETFAAGTVEIIYAQNNSTYEFTAQEMKKSLENTGYTVKLDDIGNLTNVIATDRIIITIRGTIEANNFLSQPEVPPLPSASSEGYSIRKKADSTKTDWYIIGADKNGALYGGQDFIRSVQLYGFKSIKDHSKKPYILNRGIKFNIPLDARTPGYSDNSDAAQKNIANMWDINFWHEFLDNMARNHFNMLSLWSLAPFPSFADVPEYPNAAINDIKKTTYPLSGFKSLNGTNMSNANVLANLVTLKTITLADKIKFWRDVMQYASDRGIDCYIFTWNTFTYGTENSGYSFTSAVTDLKTKDYFRKATKSLINTYPLLRGIGITAGENLKGTEAEKESFLYGAYGQGINDALKANTSRKFRLIHRAHQANISVIKTAFAGLTPQCSMRFSFKYSQAHMYSSVAPDYIYKANFLNNIGSTHFFLTVRDDDWYYSRGGSDPAFARDYIKNIPRINFSGFYLGPDGYTWGREYISKEADSPNQLVLNKRWYSFQIWGNLAYDPNLPDSLFKNILQTRFPRVNAQNLYTAWAKASQVIPWVNRFHNIGCQLDYQWYPEACFSNSGFHSVNKFISAGPQSGERLMSIPSYADAVLNGAAITGTTPLQVAQNIQALSDQALTLIADIGSTDKELRQTVSDITAMAYLGQYYSKKILGAINKSISDKTSDAIRKQEYKNKAITYLRGASECWRNYASQISYAYIPQWLTRMQQIVDVKAIQPKVDNDILLAGGTINRVAVSGVTVSPKSASIFINGTQQMAAVVSPGNATNKNIRWSSSNNSIATVNANGLVKGQAWGTATITATTLDGSMTAFCTITVTNNSRSIVSVTGS
ncbi:MAG: Ig-like domain-containing protein [Segetibacter sp.]